MNYDGFDFQQIIRDMKLEKKLTTFDMARELQVSEATISSWCNGRTRPSNYTGKLIIKLANKLNITVFNADTLK